jgi:hypothetical protein
MTTVNRRYCTASRDPEQLPVAPRGWVCSWRGVRRAAARAILGHFLLFSEGRSPVQNDVGLPAALFTLSDYEKALAIRCWHVSIAPDFCAEGRGEQEFGCPVFDSTCREANVNGEKLPVAHKKQFLSVPAPGRLRTSIS